MEFYKYQGAGNDFVIVDNMSLAVADEHASRLALSICDRRFGVGADGFIMAEPSDKADVRMNFYNADGSRAAMCGNGIRCFAKLVTDTGIVMKNEFTVETGDGIKHIHMLDKSPALSRVRVDMGSFSDMRQVKSCGFEISAMRLGVPHAVIFDEKSEYKSSGSRIDKEKEMETLSELACRYGSDIEYAQEFAPERTNVNFVRVIDKDTILCSTWERGAGKTLACGTGACSSAVAAHFDKGLPRRINVIMPGGSVAVNIAGYDGKGQADRGDVDAPGASKDSRHSWIIYMEGTAELTFKGEYLKQW